jgi:hypothetical protein
MPRLHDLALKFEHLALNLLVLDIAGGPAPLQPRTRQPAAVDPISLGAKSHHPIGKGAILVTPRLDVNLELVCQQIDQGTRLCSFGVLQPDRWLVKPETQADHILVKAILIFQEASPELDHHPTPETL